MELKKCISLILKLRLDDLFVFKNLAEQWYLIKMSVKITDIYAIEF